MKEKRIRDFWSWFTENEGTLKNAFDQYLSVVKLNVILDYTQWMDKLNQRLKAIDNHISFEFATDEEDGKYKIFLTANGDVPTFSTIFSAVELKPNLKYFNVHALRQAEEKEALRGVGMQLQGVKVKIDDIYFEYKENDVNTVDLHLYIKGYNGNMDAYGNMALLLMDRLIGEYNVATKVGRIDISKLRYANVEKYISLLEINEVMEEIFKGKDQ